MKRDKIREVLDKYAERKRKRNLLICLGMAGIAGFVFVLFLLLIL